MRPETSESTGFAAQAIREPLDVVAGAYRLYRTTTVVSGDRTATYPERPQVDEYTMEPPC
ncbi:hypothetical protein SEA_WHEELBITE_43 [Arthrobacter phage Wheelbite]|uniref:Uncharacterized protein n=1 Tax=Arthrobacter phage Wheelbite TaxID=2015873 RepID=A0A222ZIB0_9CAUD|nr:hypothetical protein KMD23_gp43 [Arthrobacter phage Wheelbite]ASR84135.1 hypothetical protein SEA_WHEELBITE_43 [Arthrobacter phage Wheelbite]